MHEPPVLIYRSEAFAEDLLDAATPRASGRLLPQLRRYAWPFMLAALGALLILM